MIFTLICVEKTGIQCQHCLFKQAVILEIARVIQLWATMSYPWPFVTAKWRAFLQTALVLTIFQKSQINIGLDHILKVPDKCSKRSMSSKQEIV